MRYLAIALLIVTSAGNCVAQEAIYASGLLPTIHDLQVANLDEIERLSILATVRFEWADPESNDTANVLALWIPTKEEFLSTKRVESKSDQLIRIPTKKGFLSTDPFPNEPERSLKKDAISIALLFGGSDGTSPPWTLFERYPDDVFSERVAITIDGTSKNSYVVSAYFDGGGPRLYVDWHVKKENCYYPHHVEERIGNDKQTATLTRESKFSYQTIDDTVLPKLVISKNFNRGTGSLTYQKTIVIK